MLLLLFLTFRFDSFFLSILILHQVAMTEKSNYGGEGGGWHGEATVLMFLPLAERKKGCMVVTIAFDGG